MVRSPAVALALCVLLVAAGAPSGVGAAAAGPPALGLDQSFDRTQFHVAVHANGSARWTFHYERTLANATEREQFETFAASFNGNETTLFTDFRNQSETLAGNGRAATGREMTARSFDRRAYVATQLNDIGVVELSFTWDGFARLEGERVIVGDVFEGGLYVGPAQSLVFRAGEGLAFRVVEPEGTFSGPSPPESDTVTWQGERTFPDNHPHVVLSPADETGAGAGGPGGDGGPGGESSSTLWPVGLVLLVVVGSVGAFLYRRRSSGDAGSAAGRDAGAVASGDPAVGDEALLGDEERVDGLLREHGGRMRQSAIVEATGWSKSKVSMVLSEMEEAGQVSKLRVGRENIVSLPGHEPAATRSPHDEGETSSSSGDSE